MDRLDVVKIQVRIPNKLDVVKIYVQIMDELDVVKIYVKIIDKLDVVKNAVVGCKYAETFGCMYAVVGCKSDTADSLPDSRQPA